MPNTKIIPVGIQVKKKAMPIPRFAPSEGVFNSVYTVKRTGNDMQRKTRSKSENLVIFLISNFE
jgi:hypothetical protein